MNFNLICLFPLMSSFQLINEEDCLSELNLIRKKVKIVNRMKAETV